MVMIGADVDELRLSGKVLEQSASDIVDHIAPALDKALTRTAWSGPDANSFKSLWFSSLSPSLKSVAGELDKAAKTLRNNADAQEDTSAQGGRFAGASGVSGASSSACDGSGKSTRSKIERPPRQGTRGFRRDLMDLARAAYDHTTGEAHEGLIPNGWEEVSRDEMAKLGINRDVLGMYGEEFSATLYRNADGKYVLAFEGTDKLDIRDLATDGVGNVLRGITSQDARAAQVAMYISQKLRASGIDASNLVMTGHSLGGRLATIGSIVTGSKAVTFNTAGTSDVVMLLARKYRGDVTGHYPSMEEMKQNVHNIIDDNDMIRRGRQLGLDANPIGSVEIVGEHQGNIFSNVFDKHGLDSLSRTYDIETWDQRHRYEHVSNSVA